MRKKINGLIEHAKQIALRLLISQEGSTSSEGAPLEFEREQFLEKRFEHWQQLINCLRECETIKDAYAGSAGSITIIWDDNSTNHNIVVEISLYAPIVAIYTYGTPPVTILLHIDKCIKKTQLFKLNSSEMAELEYKDLYHLIF